MAIKHIIVLFVETPRKFITAKLSIRKPGSSSVLLAHIISTFQRCNLTLARLPGASEYHDGQVNILSCLPDWASCLATKAGHFKVMFIDVF
jgi:hypothetical protein